MKRYILASLIVLFSSLYCTASQTDSLWNSATTLYASADYDGALNGFKSIEDQGYISAQLFYNIANCHYKRGGENALAILYYERALKLDPSFDDAKVNLGYAKQATVDKVEELPDLLVVIWINKVKNIFSADIWAYISILFIVIVLSLLLLFRFGRTARMRKNSFIFAMISLLFFVVTLTFSLILKSDFNSENEAIVMAPVTSVKSSPGDGSKSLFILHDGTKVEIIESIGSWSRIELSDGRQGWINSNDIDVI